MIFEWSEFSSCVLVLETYAKSKKSENNLYFLYLMRKIKRGILNGRKITSLIKIKILYRDGWPWMEKFKNIMNHALITFLTARFQAKRL